MSAMSGKVSQHAAQRWAIYSSVEQSVAMALAKAGEVELSLPPDIPERFKVNDAGRPVLCLMIIPGERLAKVHRALADAYSAAAGSGQKVRHTAQLWAVYHAVEEVAVKKWAPAGEIEIVLPPDIPEMFRVDREGRPASCLLSIPADKLAKFHAVLAEAYS